VTTCRSCGAPIEWAITDNERRIPLDPGEHADGRLVDVGWLHGHPLVVSLTGDQLERLRAATDADVQLRRSHFQTCPDAGVWRRPT
jgi:hypothetical protein